MLERDVIVKRLSAFYNSAKIQVNSNLSEKVSNGQINKSNSQDKEPLYFPCPKRAECLEAQGWNLWAGSEAHVGSDYGYPFRVVVISQDRGFGSQTQEHRTDEIHNLSGVSRDKLNPHMSGTLDFLEEIFKEHLPFVSNNIWSHFAMINAAKCASVGSMNSVNWPLYVFCAPYGLKEIEILDPDIVLTQGKKAQVMFDPKKELKTEIEDMNVFPAASVIPEKILSNVIQQLELECTRIYSRDQIKDIINNYISIRKINESEFIWIRNICHPSDRGGRWKLYKLGLLPVICVAAKMILKEMKPES